MITFLLYRKCGCILKWIPLNEDSFCHILLHVDYFFSFIFHRAAMLLQFFFLAKFSIQKFQWNANKRARESKTVVVKNISVALVALVFSSFQFFLLQHFLMVLYPGTELMESNLSEKYIIFCQTTCYWMRANENKPWNFKENVFASFLCILHSH